MYVISEYQVPTYSDISNSNARVATTKSAKMLCPKMFGGKIFRTEIDTHGRAWKTHRYGHHKCEPSHASVLAQEGTVHGRPDLGRSVVLVDKVERCDRAGKRHEAEGVHTLSQKFAFDVAYLNLRPTSLTCWGRKGHMT